MQKSVWKALAPLTPPGQRNDFLVWSRLRGDWAPSHPIRTLYILRGEGLVFKRVGVTDTPNLALYVRLTTDAVYATEHDLQGPVEADGPPDQVPGSSQAVHLSSATLQRGHSPSAADFVAGSSRVVQGTKRTTAYPESSRKKRRLDGGAAVDVTVSKGKGKTFHPADVIEISDEEEDHTTTVGKGKGKAFGPAVREVIEISSDEASDSDMLNFSDDD